VLETAARAAEVGWAPGEEGVIWVTDRSAESRAWVLLPGGVELGGDEAGEVVKEFAKSGDELLCFAPTGRFFAKCAPERASGAAEAFDRARAAVREAAEPGARELLEAARKDGSAPPGYAGALALELAGADSPAARLALAARVAASGHSRKAYDRFVALAGSPGIDPATAALARAGAARAIAMFGPGNPAMDAEAVRLCRDAEEAGPVQGEALRTILEVRAEVFRRAGDRDAALEVYNRLVELGFDTEDSRRWISRLQGLR